MVVTSRISHDLSQPKVIMSSELFCTTIDGGPSLTIWEIFSGNIFKRYMDPDQKTAYTAVANLPNGCGALVSTNDGHILGWGFYGEKGTQRKAIYSPEGIGAMAVNYNSTLLAVAIGREIGVYKMPSFEMQCRFTEHQAEVYSLAFERRNDVVVSGGAEGVVYRWEAKHAGQLAVYEEHKSGVVCITPTYGSAVLTASSYPEGHAILWDMRQYGWSMLRLKYGKGIVKSALCSETRQVFLGDDDGALVQYDIDTGKEVALLKVHKGPITGLWVSPLGDLLVSAGYEGYLRLWNTEDWSLRKEIDTDTGVSMMQVFQDPPKFE